MFINAKPRYVSNDFDTFVYNQKAESLHQRLVEMTNNDVNAWSVYRPAPSVTDTWIDSLDGFGNNENFPVQLSYGGYLQNPAPTSQNQHVDVSKVLYTGTTQVLDQQGSRSVAYQNLTPNMNCYEQPSPMLSHDYAQLSLGRGRGSFAEFSNARRVFKDFKHHPSADSANNSFTSMNSLGIYASSYTDEVSNFGQPLDISRTCSEEVFSCYSPKSNSVSSHILMSSSSSSGNVQQERAKWWPGNSRGVKAEDQMPYNLDMSFDGLSRCQAEQQPAQYSGSWNMTSTPVNSWTTTLNEPKTISPKALTINTSSVSLFSSGASSQVSMGLPVSSTTSTSIAGTSIDLRTQDNVAVYKSQKAVHGPRQVLSSDTRTHDSLPMFKSQRAVHQPRQSLPSNRPGDRKTLPVSNDASPSRNLRKRPARLVEPESHARGGSPPTKTAPKAIPRVQRPKERSSKSAAHRKSLPESPIPASSSWASTALKAEALHTRDAKDDFLIKAKKAGLSYKEIRKQGKFTEAESTLRGRYRTLTKLKTARVRRPEWTDEDIILLKKAVRKLNEDDKIPWKKVADYISDNGGSYHFGNATCHKRWEELQESV